MGLEGLVGFDRNFEPVVNPSNTLKHILVPGSFLARAVSFRHIAFSEYFAETNPLLPSYALRDERLEHAKRSLPGDLLFMGIGELVRLSAYAVLAYSVVKAVTSS